MSALKDPRAEQDLLRHLADTLVTDEVLGPMEKLGWSHDQPSPIRSTEDNPQTTEAPTSTEVTPAVVKTDDPTPSTSTDVTSTGDTKTDDTRIDWESLRDPSKGNLILGKYKNASDAVKGVGHAVTMAKQAFTERDNALEQLKSFGSKPAQPVNTQFTSPTIQLPQTTLSPATVKSEKLAKVLAKISDEGGILDKDNTDELLAAFSEQAMSVADSMVEKKLAERESAFNAETEQWNAVGAKMAEEYPDSIKFIDETTLFIKSNPKVSKVVAALANTGDNFAASEYAWLAYETDQAKYRTTEVKEATDKADLEKKEMQLDVRDKVRQEEVNKARLEAGVTTSSAGGVHTIIETDPSRDEIIEAVREMNATGLGTKWRALTIGKDLPDAIFASQYKNN